MATWTKIKGVTLRGSSLLEYDAFPALAINASRNAFFGLFVITKSTSG